MSHLFISLTALQPMFQLFLQLIALFVCQELLSWFLGKLLKLKNAPLLVNLTVYASFALILVWYIDAYVFTYFSRFVQFFFR